MAFVLAMARLPLVYGIGTVALALLPTAAIDAGRCARGAEGVLGRIALPLAAPLAAAGLALAFLLSLLEHGVPTLLQVRGINLAIYAEYSASGQVGRARVGLGRTPLREALQLVAREVFRLPARVDLPPEELPEWAQRALNEIVPAEVDWELMSSSSREWMSEWDARVRGKGRG